MTEKHVEHREKHPEYRRCSTVPEWSRHPAWMLATLVLVVVVAATFFLKPTSAAPAPEVCNVSAAPKSNVSLQVETYLTENFFQSQGLRAEVMSLEDYGNDLFLATVAVKNGTETMNTALLLVTKSGDFIVLAPTQYVLNTTKKLELPSAATPTPQEIPKLAKPEVKMFVMSFCPYGQEAEKMIAPVAALFKDKASIEPHFVIYDKSLYAGAEAKYCIEDVCSMHRIPELKENMRQACLWKYDKKKWWAYVLYVNENCSLDNIDGCWKNAANATGVNQTEIEACVASEGVALMQAEKNLNSKLGVQGSETIFVNSVRVSPAQYRFDANKMKSVICSAFTEAPAECQQTLTAGVTSPPSGSCG